MRTKLSDSAAAQLDEILNVTNASAILAHLSRRFFEYEDSVGTGLLGQMGAALRASELFCREMEREIGEDIGEECE